MGGVRGVGVTPDIPEPRPDALLDVLLLRLEAPLMSFGGVAIDETRGTLEHPGRSMLTGLLANALGWSHGQFEALQGLQERLDFAVRQDRPGRRLRDYHTVDLGQDFLLQGWTTRGAPEGRGKGEATRGTHIRERHFLADAAYTVALTLHPADASPTLDDVEAALLRPARPLFLGRKTCLPSRPLLGHRDLPHRLRAGSLVEALAKPEATAWTRDMASSPRLWWFHTDIPKDHPTVRFHRHRPITDDRVWSIQKHTGRRMVHEGVVRLPDSAQSAASSAQEVRHG